MITSTTWLQWQETLSPISILGTYSFLHKKSFSIKSVKTLFENGHNTEAVEKAYKFLNNLVKKRTNLTPSRSGADLMRKTFSQKKPILRLNAGVTTSEKDEQRGYMDIFAGVMTGIRNPRSHEDEWEDQEYRALQLLMLADHLVDRVKNSVKES